MKAKLLHEDDGQRTFALVFDTGDSVMDLLRAFAVQEKISGAQFTGIGAFGAATLGYFDWEKKDYVGRDFAEQMEVASLTGDVAVGPDRAPAIHVHCVLGRRDYSALAGHLVKATVRPTLELVLTESPVHLRKKHDPNSGLALIDLDSSTGSKPPT
ncbi:MAG: DNA-binding protein [Reyranella sp.]|nr:DNA-binding protein [Reyranella sp.]